jgi:glyoxylate/hydroxypyruvate reductase A
LAKKSILIAIGSGDPAWRPQPWAEAIRVRDPDRPVTIWPDLGDPSAIGYAMAWKPPEGSLARLPKLEVVFSLGAGVDHIVFQRDLPDAPLVRIVSPSLTQRMTEWVVLQVLLHHRQQRAYDRFQRDRHWEELPQRPAGSVRVGIMGLGVLGRAAAEALLRLGFQVAGWSRRPAALPGVESFHGAEGLDPFLARTDMLVCLLPLTPDTRGILALPLFTKLARGGAPRGGPVLINGGRGRLQVEADIVAALNEGVLAGASLDVFEKEPLDPRSPLWVFENVVITPHCAASSSADELVDLVLGQITAYEAGKPLRHVVDRITLY